MESYNSAAAEELGPYGIMVNVVAPGAMNTAWLTGQLIYAGGGDVMPL
ncbi:MAG: hypothetical protein ACRDGN_05685 [bacterium]